MCVCVIEKVKGVYSVYTVYSTLRTPCLYYVIHSTYTDLQLGTHTHTHTLIKSECIQASHPVRMPGAVVLIWTCSGWVYFLILLMLFQTVSQGLSSSSCLSHCVVFKLKIKTHSVPCAVVEYCFCLFHRSESGIGGCVDVTSPEL